MKISHETSTTSLHRVKDDNVSLNHKSSFCDKITSLKNTPDYLLLKKPVSGYSSNGVVHLSDMKLETYNERLCVRLYCVVVDEQKISDVKNLGDNAKGKSKYKDVIIGPEGKIIFSEGEGDGLWINVGRPERAYEWHQKYTNQFPDKTPAIRSWCVELEVFKECISDCEALDIKGNSYTIRGSTLNTDQTSAPNQFLFKGDSLNTIIKKSIPETYKTLQGENVREITKEFGLHRELKTIDLFSTKQGEFQTHHDGIAKELNTHYLTWVQTIYGKKGKDVVDASVDMNMFYNKKLENSEQKQNKVYQIRLDKMKEFLLKEGVISYKDQDLRHPDIKFFMENIVVENANIARAKSVLKDDYQHMLNLNKKGYVI